MKNVHNDLVKGDRVKCVDANDFRVSVNLEFGKIYTFDMYSFSGSIILESIGCGYLCSRFEYVEEVDYLQLAKEVCGKI